MTPEQPTPEDVEGAIEQLNGAANSQHPHYETDWVLVRKSDLRILLNADCKSILSAIGTDTRIEVLVEAAYREGWRDSENSTNGLVCIQESESWERSKALATLNQTKEPPRREQS